MQQQSNPALFNALVAALPLQFLEGLATVLPHVNAEALASAHDSPLLDESEAAYLVPHFRRAFFEKQFRDIGRANGLNATVAWTRGETAQFSVVRAGQFVFTASYVSEPGGSTRAAAFRSDLSTLNDLLEQGQLFTEDQAPLPKGAQIDNKDIYCILVYGGGAKGASLFMQFVFPAPLVGGSVDRYNLDEVLVAARALGEAPAPAQKDNAFPKRKPKQDKDAGTGTDASENR